MWQNTDSQLITSETDQDTDVPLLSTNATVQGGCYFNENSLQTHELVHHIIVEQSCAGCL